MFTPMYNFAFHCLELYIMSEILSVRYEELTRSEILGMVIAKEEINRNLSKNLKDK